MKTVPRFLLSVCAAVIVLAGCKKEGGVAAAFNNDLPETAPAIQTAVTTSISPAVGGFYKALPAHYQNTTKKYPLLVFLHGAEETGNGGSDLSRLLLSGMPKLLQQQGLPARFTVNGDSYSFIVISPQFNTWPQAADVNAVIDYAVANYRVDESRIYVAGQSMGGGSAWDYAVAYPNRIAAVVPISGASWPSKSQLSHIAGATLPVWAFHNSKDNIIDMRTTTGNTAAINAFSPAIRAENTIWQAAGHDAWTKAIDPATKACNGKNIYEWMLQYQRPIAH